MLTMAEIMNRICDEVPKPPRLDIPLLIEGYHVEVAERSRYRTPKWWSVIRRKDGVVVACVFGPNKTRSRWLAAKECGLTAEDLYCLA